MKNAIALGALIAVLSLSSSYGESLENNTCELLNGKAECAAKKGVNSVKNGTDKIEDAVE